MVGGLVIPQSGIAGRREGAHLRRLTPALALSGSAEFAHFKLCDFSVGGGGYNLALCLVCGAWFCRTVFSL